MNFVKNVMLPFAFSVFLLSISALAISTAYLVYKGSDAPLEIYQ